MPKPKRPPIAARKPPRQVRSAQLVEDILEASIRILLRGDAPRLTTVSVADEAGVSVGSLYQYFPNKEALLFRLQTDEWSDTWDLMDEILGDKTRSPMDRLRRGVLTFFRSEREESRLRRALDDAGAPFRDAPEARALLAKARARVLRFVLEAVPGLTQEAAVFAADFVLTSMTAVAERVTSERRSRTEVDAWARASAELYCSYLSGLLPPSLPSPKGRKRSVRSPRQP
jgi:AcrR family transcriptional regulator